MRGEEHKRRLEALKAKIVNSGGKVWEYTADWDAEKNCVTGLEELKEKIIFVLTCAGDFAIPARLKEKINYRTYTLDALNENERKLVLQKLELRHRKELPLEVKNTLLARKEAGNPLYLSLMYHRLLMLDRDDFLEISRLGDGMEGITAYMLRLLEEAPGEIEGVAAMLMEEAAGRINKELCQEVLRLMSVTRRGLRETDFKIIFRKRRKTSQTQYQMTDFYRLKDYMAFYFFERSDGRYDFTYEIFRSGILKNLEEQELKELHEEIYALLASLADKDPVHKDEYAWFAWKCDKKADFLERIGKRTKEWWLLGYSYPVARGLYDICLQDQGRWLVEMLKEYTGQEAFLSLETRVAVERLFGILSKLFPLFFKTAGERKILIPIWEEALLVAAELAQRYHTENSIDNLKILAYKIGNAYEQCQMFEQALEYYLKTLEIYDAWGPGAVKAEKILEQIGDVYRLCGRYDRAWEYYRKAIEGNESQAKAGILFAVSADLVANYEKAVAFWKALGKHEEAATYQRKLNGIKELQERIAAERGDNLFSTFAFAVKIPFQDFMDDAAGHKHSGKIAEALQCCQGAFALLESEGKKMEQSGKLAGFGRALQATGG